MSACFAFDIEAGRPISEKVVNMGFNPPWRQNPVYVIILLGAYATNLTWCLIPGVKNKTLGDFNISSPSLLMKNYLFSALAGEYTGMSGKIRGKGSVPF